MCNIIEQVFNEKLDAASLTGYLVVEGNTAHGFFFTETQASTFLKTLLKNNINAELREVKICPSPYDEPTPPECPPPPRPQKPKGKS